MNAGVIDVARWSRLAVGADGGEGSAWFCPAVRQIAASEIALSPGARDSVSMTIELKFPGSDVTEVTSSVASIGGATRLGMVGSRALAPLLDALRSMGGAASAQTVTTTVRCVLDGPVVPMTEYPQEPDPDAKDAGKSTR
jgi:hypothetical protein